MRRTQDSVPPSGRSSLAAAMVLVVGLMLVAGCVAPAPSDGPGADNGPGDEVAEDEPMPFQITSSAFTHGERMPERHTCDGDDTTPPLAWREAPEGTIAFAMIMDDPDAPVGTWTHWVWWDLDATTTGLAEGENPADLGAHIGKNSWGGSSWGGPCPPPGDGDHRYFFKLYALDAKLDLEAGSERDVVEAAIDKHKLDEVRLMGTYARALAP